MKKCSRKGCDNVGEKVMDKHGLFYCIKHCRITRMIRACYGSKKDVPSYKFLENLWDDLLKKNFKCPCCNKKMNQTTLDGHSRKDTVSLQHWRSGEISLICLECNTKHGGSKLGDDWANIPIDHRHCPDCEKIKHIDDFYKNCRNCKKCRNIRTRIYREKNPEITKKSAIKYYKKNRDKINARKRELRKQSKLKKGDQTNHE